MQVRTDISLKNYTTMRLGGDARFFADVHSKEDIDTIVRQSKMQNLPIYILGGGSNTVANDDRFEGIIVHNRIRGFEVIEDTADNTIVRIGAGENWDEIVKKTVDRNLSGIEALSGVPGTVGAAPVQNIGAYGQEVGDAIISVDAYDTQTLSAITLTAEQCHFAYRHSIFRGEDYQRYIIMAVTLKLSKAAPQPPFYSALQDYFDTHAISFFTPQTVRDGVLAIRFAKLPDPSIHPNAGSFFKNAIIDDWLFEELLQAYPTMPNFDMPDGRHKIPTGWLIEQAGFKGQLLHGIRVHDKNALVLINESATGYTDLAAARAEIIAGVQDKFRILIEQEPLEI